MTIKPIKVIFSFTPVEYFDYCEEEGIEPTQEDFENFIGVTYFDEWYNSDYTIERS